MYRICCDHMPELQVIPNSNEFFYFCPVCKSRGPKAGDADKALTLWNQSIGTFCMSPAELNFRDRSGRTKTRAQRRS